MLILCIHAIVIIIIGSFWMAAASIRSSVNASLISTTHEGSVQSSNLIPMNFIWISADTAKIQSRGFHAVLWECFCECVKADLIIMSMFMLVLTGMGYEVILSVLQVSMTFEILSTDVCFIIDWFQFDILSILRKSSANHLLSSFLCIIWPSSSLFSVTLLEKMEKRLPHYEQCKMSVS